MNKRLVKIVPKTGEVTFFLNRASNFLEAPEYLIDFLLYQYTMEHGFEKIFLINRNFILE